MNLTTFPHEFQMDAKDCGPASLMIIAKFYGKYYSLQYLRDLCGITREGVSFLDISYAGDKIGLRTVSVKASMHDIVDRISLPCIIHWNANHFIVVYKASKTKIYVSDPAKGLVSYSHEEFKDKWYKKGEETGVLMALEPMANFKQIEANEKIERLKSFENLLGYFLPYKKAFGILLFIMLMATLLQAFLPFISKPVIDSPFDHENVGEEVYFHILNHAKKYVHIMTPYLILDNEMLTTLIRAAKSGIEVIIIMPHIPDKWYAFAVAKTYYKELIEGGVQIYEYTPGFVHAKIFVSDDDTATVGSINLDFRSLYLHFENGVFIYDNPEVQKVEEDFQNTLAKCHKVTVTEVRNRGILMKTAGQVLRLVAPLM